MQVSRMADGRVAVVCKAKVALASTSFKEDFLSDWTFNDRNRVVALERTIVVEAITAVTAAATVLRPIALDQQASPHPAPPALPPRELHPKLYNYNLQSLHIHIANR